MTSTAYADVDYGFIGLGNMGFHMAANMRKKMDKSATLHVFDVNEDICKKFQDKFSSRGPIRIATSSKDVAQHSVTLIAMVPMDEHARAVCLHPETGVVAAGLSKDRLILDSSTLSVSTAKYVGQQLMDAGAGTYIDTPVSGGVAGAEAGTLSFFCGSPSSPQSGLIVRRLMVTLSWMGDSEHITLCGRLGAGLTTKLVNNYIALGNLAVAAQGVAFGIRQGLDPKTLYKCVKGSTGDSLVWNAMHPVPGVNPKSASSNSFKAGFSSRLGLKDLSLAIKAGEDAGIDVSMGRIASELYRQADQDPRTTVSLPP
ncbi:uncharacterized protein A1O9_11734 [Exophiala aquamarina CBS 119918]|uniref:3-hydroxyisobutyrate dehydrogenase n=1 Tax=Exophiala aquamarina CBS 119918 TaxID=1182545 RepID=A0A072NYK4_9EURO|nr:uncharacterized protein A1O9_11734 [Exophiala aquamarina CBS 119918]KEF52108.1 hypothetical protein A1O9_11734 [Exophiala aquamarina CBS 119918]